MPFPRERPGGAAPPASSLLGAGGAAGAVPAAAGSAPLLAGRPQGPADVAPAACGQEAPVYIPAVLTSSWSLIKRSSRPLFLFCCIRFHIGPGPTWIGSSSTSAPSYFQTAEGRTRSANPHGWAPQPCRRQQLCSLAPAPSGPPESGRISSFPASHGHDGEQPTPRVHARLLPTRGRGRAARTWPVAQAQQLLAPKGAPFLAFHSPA